MQLTIILAIFVAITGVIFAMQNNVPVIVNFLSWQFDSSLAMVLLVALAAGAIIVALLTTPSTLRRQWQLSRQKRKIDDQEKTIAQQKERISELERISPESLEMSPLTTDYVGLKALAMSEDEDLASQENKGGKWV